MYILMCVLQPDFCLLLTILSKKYLHTQDKHVCLYVYKCARVDVHIYSYATAYLGAAIAKRLVFSRLDEDTHASRAFFSHLMYCGART